MSDVIQLLPDSVANQIAAGEVIQRPAAVVKELVENAIDAGATLVQIVIKDAGRTLIQVIDNGKGMSETDARLSFERHATSKIRQAGDLFALRTMGFRGEALASIAAIAQVELKTRRMEDEVGTAITLAASVVESQECVSCPAGSNFSVKNIFYNVPARRKFLKSNQVELSNILSEFERIALVNPEIAFELIHNDNELFNLPVSNFRQRIISLFGKSMNQQLLTVEVETSLVKISGYIGKPEASRKRNALQYFFVNGRYMRHPYFHKAVMQSYEQLIPVGEMPNYFINLTVDPASIDVNIHPTKTEIKFENEQPIWQILSAAVKEALGKFSAVPSIDFDMEGAPEIPVFHKGDSVKPPHTSFTPGYNPFKSSSAATYKRPDYDWNQLYSGFESAKDMPRNSGEEEPRIFPSKVNQSVVPDDSSEGISPSEPIASKMNDSAAPVAGGQYLQVKGRYIITSVKSGVVLIDQYRAHVRILYDRYISHIRSGQGVSQRVLFPEMIHLSASQGAILAGIKSDLDALGFDLSDMGGGTYSINGVPGGIEGVDVVGLLNKMIETASEKGGDIKSDVHESIALTLAESAAIPYGQILSPLEMEQLADDLFASVMPGYTPDGRTTLTVFSAEELQKRFK